MVFLLQHIDSALLNHEMVEYLLALAISRKDINGSVLGHIIIGKNGFSSRGNAG